MIKVEKIKIEDFRGIRNLTLDLKGKNYVVYGPNGTGKSGVVDALEFAFTGNISRLSGEGMGNVSVKEHAPHVDIRGNPENARITAVFKIPSLGNKQVTVVRTVKNAASPKFTPSSQEILAVLKQFDKHPEFVLSRREIIRYIISKPGDRSEEIQALLRLDKIGDIRKNLKTILNAYEKERKDSEKEKIQYRESLEKALDIEKLSENSLLEAVNLHRAILGLNPIKKLTQTTALNEGLHSGTTPATVPQINKISAAADLKKYSEAIQKLKSEIIALECKDLKKQLTTLNDVPMVAESVSREKFLRDAINFVTESACPVCDTTWDIQTLKSIISSKLQRFEKITTTRTELERRLEPIVSHIEEVCNTIYDLERPAKVLVVEHIDVFSSYRNSLNSYCKVLKDFLPLAKTISAIEKITTIPDSVMIAIGALEKAITAIPEPTQQETSRDYLVRAQDRLEAYRIAMSNDEKANERSRLAKKVYEIYVEVSNRALEEVYKVVESEFSSLYRFINNEDEGNFDANLTPSIGKLGFDVDFYGRGHFPPGAYHSEGHQDAMGLCLYLALMKKLQGNDFMIAVLDDVLMSVDTDHRREVCNLLKEKFPETQFILTTHDKVWSKLLTTIGLVPAENTKSFRNWTPELGPVEWKTLDGWSEIDDSLRANDVRKAASLLRYYLEHFFIEVCDKLRVRVEFRGDHRYELGDILAPAVRHFRDLLQKGKKAAEEWGHEDMAKALMLKEKELRDSFCTTNAEQWQVNPAIHYNEWANFTANDFFPVVTAFHNLVEKFICENPDCGIFYLTTSSPKTLDSLRCACGSMNINLKNP